MEQITTVGSDIAKHALHVRAVDERGRTLFGKRASRAGFFLRTAAPLHGGAERTIEKISGPVISTGVRRLAFR